MVLEKRWVLANFQGVLKSWHLKLESGILEFIKKYTGSQILVFWILKLGVLQAKLLSLNDSHKTTTK